MLLVEIAVMLQCTAEYWLNEDTARHDGNTGEVNTQTVSVCTLFILIRSPLADARHKTLGHSLHLKTDSKYYINNSTYYLLRNRQNMGRDAFISVIFPSSVFSLHLPFSYYLTYCLVSCL